MNQEISYWDALKKLFKDFIDWFKHPNKKGIYTAINLIYFITLWITLYIATKIKRLFKS